MTSPSPTQPTKAAKLLSDQAKLDPIPPLHVHAPMQAQQISSFPNSNMKVATFNCNGLLTVPANSTDPEQRIHTVMRFIRRAGVSVLGLQEPHLKDDAMFLQVKEALSRKNLKCVSNFSPHGRGGAAIIFPKTWKVRQSWALEPRSLYVMLEDEQGFFA